jgi:hypothetical protein
LAAGFLPALFLATARFFFRATAVFFVFFVFLAFAFFDFLVFDFAFFAMIVLPIVSAQISVRLPVRLTTGTTQKAPAVLTSAAAALRASWSVQSLRISQQFLFLRWSCEASRGLLLS